MRILSKDLVKVMNRDGRLQLLEFAKICCTPPPDFSYEVRGTKKKVYHFCTVTLPLSRDVMRRLGLRELKGAGLARVKRDATIYGAMSVIEMLEFGLGASMADINREYRRVAEAEAAKMGVKIGVQGGKNAPQDMASGMGVDLKTLKEVGGEDSVNAARMVYLTATAPPKVEYYEQLAKDGVHPQVNVTYYVVPKIPSKKNPDCRPEKLVAVAHGGSEDHKNEVEVIAFLKAAKMLVGPLGKRRCREVLRQVQEYPNLGLAAVFPQLSQMQSNGLGNAIINHQRAIDALALEQEGQETRVVMKRILRKVELIGKEDGADNFEDPGWRDRLARVPLPVDAVRDELLDALENSNSVVIEGGTGSGKTTRVPQFVLDDALEKGEAANCSILVAEPRRIAAVSAASRVCSERGDQLGDGSASVGYHIRLERKAPRPRGNIEFVTTGVLLRRLQANPTLDGVSHVIVDEVHERDSNTDFLLIALKEALAANSSGRLKVLVMSATLDSGALRRYLGNCPALSVPSGPRFEVKESFLDDLTEGPFKGRDIWLSSRKIMQMERAMNPSAAMEEQKVIQEDLLIKGEGKAADHLRQLAVDRVATGSVPQTGRMSMLPAANRLFEASQNGADPYGTGGIDPSQRKEEELTYEMLQVELMANCVYQLVRQRRVPPAGGGGGCVLCFLPGWEEIQAVRGYLQQSIPSRVVRILPLHSSIPNQQQRVVFEPVPHDQVKIVLATNIAETSITIPDVTVVVDTGRAREMNYHSNSKYSSLDLTHISEASATQRKGRAGRVRRGNCIRLYSKSMSGKLVSQSVPEMKRCSLESLCLQALAITSLPVQTFLAKALDPPSPQRIAEAMKELLMLGAVRYVAQEVDGLGGGVTEVYKEELTPLGDHLAALPVEPLLGRMILLSIVLGGFETGLTIAAVLSVPDIFLSSARGDSKRRLQEFCATSDVLAMVAAYNTWSTILRDRGPDAARSFAYDSELSIPSLTMIDGIRKQLRGVLRARGFFSRAGTPDKLIMDLNEHGGRLGLQLALVCSAIPNMGHRTTGSQNIITRSVPDAHIHPSSVNHVPPGSRAAWYLYQEMLLTSRPYLRNSTVVSALEIVLYGGSFLDDDALGGCVLDHWILTKGDPDNIQLLIQARRLINKAMEELAEDPARNPSPTEKRLIATTFELIEQTRGTQLPVAISGQVSEMPEGDLDPDVAEAHGQLSV